MPGKFLGYLLLAGLAILFSSCISSRVKTDADLHADLTSYRTFMFTDTDTTGSKEDPLLHNSLLEKVLHMEITSELSKRGVMKISHDPYLLIAYHTYTEKKQSPINSYYPMMYGGWGWSLYPWGFSPYPFGYWNGYNEQTYQYTEGTLIIDAIDARSKQLIWRGSISDAINRSSNLQKKAIQAVRLIFNKYPVHMLDKNARPLANRMP